MAITLPTTPNINIITGIVGTIMGVLPVVLFVMLNWSVIFIFNEVFLTNQHRLLTCMYPAVVVLNILAWVDRRLIKINSNK
uniref:Uncharacterized protein n=1 Tax=Anguilla anguilla TaxID=7936 RepID=A0A0E9WDM5_ANGAN